MNKFFHFIEILQVLCSFLSYTSYSVKTFRKFSLHVLKHGVFYSPQKLFVQQRTKTETKLEKRKKWGTSNL